MIYGATGYTGRMLAHAARTRGLPLLVGGRDPSRLPALARELGCEHRVARLDELDGALSGVSVLLNAAGPFAATATPVARACIGSGVHYLDVSAEIDAIATLARLGDEAAGRGVMLMPAVGFDVVPSDGLALHVVRRLRGALRLTLAVSGLDLVSRGSARTMLANAGHPIRVRRGGTLVEVAPGASERAFDFGSGPRTSTLVDWADVVTAYYSTGVPDIEIFFEATPAVQAMVAANRTFGTLVSASGFGPLLDAWAGAIPEGPSERERARRSAVIVAEAEDRAGRRTRARLCTPEAYTFTCSAALAVSERVLRGDCERGFQTPARVYGPDFVLSLPGVTREDLDARSTDHER